MIRSLWGMETCLEQGIKKRLYEKKPFQLKLESYNRVSLGQGGSKNSGNRKKAIWIRLGCRLVWVWGGVEWRAIQDEVAEIGLNLNKPQ